MRGGLPQWGEDHGREGEASGARGRVTGGRGGLPQLEKDCQEEGRTPGRERITSACGGSSSGREETRGRHNFSQRATQF